MTLLPPCGLACEFNQTRGICNTSFQRYCNRNCQSPPIIVETTHARAVRSESALKYADARGPRRRDSQNAICKPPSRHTTPNNECTHTSGRCLRYACSLTGVARVSAPAAPYETGMQRTCAQYPPLGPSLAACSSIRISH